MDAHHEIHFEDFIVDYLGRHGWLVGDSAAFEREGAIYPEDVIGWLKDSQADAWARLEAANGAATAKLVTDRLVRALDKDGTLEVLRRGINVAGAGRLAMSQGLPEDERNAQVQARFAANRLRVVRQLRYAPERDWSLDLAFFVNGIPVATAELKSDFTQSVEDAIWQYRRDRGPRDPQTGRKLPLLGFKRGAVVHFAVSTSEVWMTTHLRGDATRFLPFNQGWNEGKGNPPAKDGRYPVAYLWERILAPASFLRILHRFVLGERAEKEHADGRPYIDETVIFPRYHQWEAVTRLIDTVCAEGPGQRYLVQHSAGSGKTNSISWVCHELIRLRRPDGTKYFDSVIVVTDRTVLDAQLQDAIQQIDHQMGVVRAIDRESSPLPKSQQLAEALVQRTPIVVVTLQSFPPAMEAILSETSLNDRHFAVVVDEAHTSQTGGSAAKLRAVLALDKTEDLAAMTPDEILERLQAVRKFPPNVSYLAFTATPKHSTLELFGRLADPSQPRSKDNPPRPFHVYSMQQAIEEGFILDVLRNYTAYQAALRLGQALDRDARVDSRQARRKLARWIALHPTNVGQKVEFIVEHFRANVAHLLGGQAKAMVVTGSRAAAVGYKLGFDAYVGDRGYEGLRALVAFSGKVPGKDVDPTLAGEEFTESGMNPEVRNQDLRNAFEGRTWTVMIVANKFQTGFDQPKLVAMYLDKKVSGVEAVQTLSRLNRTYPGKDRTYVIDFANDPAEIQAAFRLFYREARIQDIQDPNVVYDIRQALDAAMIYTADEVRRCGEELTRPKPRQGMLASITDHAVRRYDEQMKGLNEAIGRWERELARCEAAGDACGAEKAELERSASATARDGLVRFKEGLAKFVRTYEYIAQIVDLADGELEAFAGYARLLRNRLKGINPEEIDLTGLQLTHYAIRPRGLVDGVDDGSEVRKGAALRPITESGTADPRDRERAFLSELIARLNDLFGADLSDTDKVAFTRHIADKVREDAAVMAEVHNNEKRQALKGRLPEATRDAIVDALASHRTLVTRLLKDEEAREAFVSLMYDVLQGERRAGHSGDAGTTPR